MTGAPFVLCRLRLATRWGELTNNRESVFVEPLVEALDEFHFQMQVFKEVHLQTVCRLIKHIGVNLVPERSEQVVRLLVLIIVPEIEDDPKRDSHVFAGADERVGERVARHALCQVEQLSICQKEPMTHFQGTHS